MAEQVSSGHQRGSAAMRRSAPPALVLALCLALVSCSAPASGSHGAATAAGDAAPKATVATTAKVGAGRPSCPITRPPQPPFVPPKPYRATPPRLYGGFWYGSDQLWTMLPADGTWEMARDKDGLFDKSLWWRAGFDPRREQTPSLTLSARRLDVPGRAIAASSGKATNGWRDDDDIGAFMLTGIELPAAGCWEITGHYRARELSFVVWVT
jgi:hypothetical protein